MPVPVLQEFTVYFIAYISFFTILVNCKNMNHTASLRTQFEVSQGVKQSSHKFDGSFGVLRSSTAGQPSRRNSGWILIRRVGSYVVKMDKMIKAPTKRSLNPIHTNQTTTNKVPKEKRKPSLSLKPRTYLHKIFTPVYRCDAR